MASEIKLFNSRGERKGIWTKKSNISQFKYVVEELEVWSIGLSKFQNQYIISKEKKNL